MIIRIKNRSLRKPAMPERTTPKAAGLHHVLKIDVRETQALDKSVEAVQLPVKLRRVEPKAFAKLADRGAQDEDEPHEENRQQDQHDEQG
jgi:hypothetical protein